MDTGIDTMILVSGTYDVVQKLVGHVSRALSYYVIMGPLGAKDLA